MNLAPRDKLEKPSLYSESKGKLPVEKTPSTFLKDENANYQLGAIKGKGMGLIASRDIKKGELILAEDPVLKYEKTGSIKERDVHELAIAMKQLLNVYRCKFQKLPSHIQKDILALYSNPMIQYRVVRCLKEYLPGVSPDETLIKFASNSLTNSFCMDT